MREAGFLMRRDKPQSPEARLSPMNKGTKRRMSLRDNHTQYADRSRCVCVLRKGKRDLRITFSEPDNKPTGDLVYSGQSWPAAELKMLKCGFVLYEAGTSSTKAMKRMS
jgi:hypothetical protein